MTSVSAFSAADAVPTTRRRRDPWLLLFLLATLAPVTAGLLFSALYSVGGIGLLSRGWTWQYWQQVLSGDTLLVSLAFSIYIAFTALLISAGVAVALVLALRQRLQQGLLGLLVYLPLTIPALAGGLVTFEVFSGAGLLSRLTHALGLTASANAFPALVFDRAGIGILLAEVSLIAPFFVLLFERFLAAEQADELGRLAATLGASPRQVRNRVLIPLLLRRARGVLSLYFIFLLGAFEIPLLVGAQYPSMISVLIQHRNGLYDLAGKPQAYVMATVYTLLVMVALGLLFRRRTSPQ